MHPTFVNRFSNCFPDMVMEIKSNSLIPLLKLFLKELESRGFTLEEIVIALGDITNERGLSEETSQLDRMLSEEKNPSNI